MLVCCIYLSLASEQRRWQCVWRFKCGGGLIFVDERYLENSSLQCETSVSGNKCFQKTEMKQVTRLSGEFLLSGRVVAADDVHMKLLASHKNVMFLVLQNNSIK